MTTPDVRSELLARARAGDHDALGELLERHRGYLHVIAERIVGRRLGNRLDVSDIVQQTCLSAFGKIEDFQGDTGEFLAWLRIIHERNVKNALRDHVGAQKRSVNREAPQDGEFPLAAEIAREESSPSQRMMLGEQAVQLAQALQFLPDDQREAVRLRYLEGWPLARIAEVMGRSKFSVAGLIKRGLIGLRKHLRKENA